MIALKQASLVYQIHFQTSSDNSPREWVCFVSSNENWMHLHSCMEEHLQISTIQGWVKKILVDLLTQVGIKSMMPTLTWALYKSGQKRGEPCHCVFRMKRQAICNSWKDLPHQGTGRFAWLNTLCWTWSSSGRIHFGWYYSTYKWLDGSFLQWFE